MTPPTRHCLTYIKIYALHTHYSLYITTEKVGYSTVYKYEFANIRADSRQKIVTSNPTKLTSVQAPRGVPMSALDFALPGSGNQGTRLKFLYI